MNLEPTDPKNEAQAEMPLPSDSESNSLKTPREVNVHVEDVYRIFQSGSLEVVALKGVNMKIYAGEIVVIMGPSGSGKTTLLNCFSGLDRPSAGKVFIRGGTLPE